MFQSSILVLVIERHPDSESGRLEVEEDKSQRSRSAGGVAASGLTGSDGAASDSEITDGGNDQRQTLNSIRPVRKSAFIQNILDLRNALRIVYFVARLDTTHSSFLFSSNPVNSLSHHRILLLSF